MRGRTPSGPEVIEHLHGSAKAKERLRVILETMQGKWRVGAACAQLGISEQRYRQLRAEVLQAALAGLEDQPAGRPRRPQEAAETIALREQVAQLQRALQVAQVYEEIALALPHVVATPAAQAAAAAPKKKRRRRRSPS